MNPPSTAFELQSAIRIVRPPLRQGSHVIFLPHLTGHGPGQRRYMSLQVFRAYSESMGHTGRELRPFSGSVRLLPRLVPPGLFPRRIHTLHLNHNVEADDRAGATNRPSCRRFLASKLLGSDFSRPATHRRPTRIPTGHRTLRAKFAGSPVVPSGSGAIRISTRVSGAVRRER